MTQTSYRFAPAGGRGNFDQAPLDASHRKLSRPNLPREFDGVPGLRNSQALRDWGRATADLERAKQRDASAETLNELTRDVARAYARLLALSARHR
jgi:hypothetical protein